MYYLVGLGNPGEEYENNRHNTGRQALEYFARNYNGKKAKIIVPDTFMNHSGKAVAKFIKTKKAAEKLVIVYDDIDLPLGTIKISFNKSSGGHNGLESVIKAVKNREFIRIRIGISAATPKGKVRKPSSEDATLKYLLGDWKPAEAVILKKVFKIVAEAITVLLEEGKERAMNQFN